MSVLLLCLAGPLQSWGVASRHNNRDSLPVPTKSGVVGLLANALGRHRADSIADLSALRFGVRVDQPGERIADFHTVSGASHAPLDADRQRLPTAQGGSLRPADSTKVTRRYYLTDAVFVAGVEGEVSIVELLAEALRRPCRPLFLGRRSCPPSRPVLLGVRRDVDLEAALAETEWQAGEHWQRRTGRPPELAILVEDANGDDTVLDHPLSFRHDDRRYAARAIRYGQVWLDSDGGPPPDPHDPFTLLTR